MDERINEIRDNFRKKLDKIYEAISALGRETTDKIIACGGTHEDVLNITQDYLDRGILWCDDFMEAFKVTMSEIQTMVEA